MLALAAPLAVTACADNKTAARGDCTDADPTLAIPSVAPDVVGCDSKEARS